MKKQELIHLHGLLARLADRHEEFADRPVPTPEYDALQVGPTSIHRSKTDHKEAVFALVNQLADGMKSKRVPTTAD
ncbi:metal-binding protein [Halobacteriales archaeon SW_7_68_16]|nr:MAG: metal-binding protein [Halobacteriales archaeon SW_7_68_16]